MKQIILLLSLCGLLTGCSLFKEHTIAGGIDFGMTQEQVLANLEKTQKVITRDDSKIITEGYDKLFEMNRRNVFWFKNGKLARHDNGPM
jgi:hypothetical protein